MKSRKPLGPQSRPGTSLYSSPCAVPIPEPPSSPTPAGPSPSNRCTSPNRPPAKFCCAWRPAASVHSDLFVAGLEKLPLAPLTLGHEGIGRVEAVGPGVDGWAAGDRAGITFLGVTCGTCEWCVAGPRALLSETDQLRLHPAGRARRLRAGSRLRPGARSRRPRRRRCRAALLRRLDRLRRASRGRPRARPIGGALRLRRPRPPGAADRAASGTARVGLRSLRGKAGAGARRRSGNRRAARNVDAAIVFTAAPAAIPQAFRSLRRNGTLILVGLAVTSTNFPWSIPFSRASRSAAAIWARATIWPPSSRSPARASCAPTCTPTPSTKPPRCSTACAAASFRDGP